MWPVKFSKKFSLQEIDEYSYQKRNLLISNHVQNPANINEHSNRKNDFLTPFPLASLIYSSFFNIPKRILNVGYVKFFNIYVYMW